MPAPWQPTKEKPKPDDLRAQILRICSYGMRHVTLSFADDAELLQACEFLERCSPWQYVAPVKKSQVHHAMAEVLTQVCLLV